MLAQGHFQFLNQSVGILEFQSGEGAFLLAVGVLLLPFLDGLQQALFVRI